jgi:hypothetical protein
MLILVHAGRFHVDDLSSAHVYLRLPPGMAFEDIDKTLVQECSQLVKANSIQGMPHDTMQHTT